MGNENGQLRRGTDEPVATLGDDNERRDAAAEIDFDNTEIAFRSRSNLDLQMSYWLFKALSYSTLAELGPKLVNWALWWHLPVKLPVRATVFRQFCGGESFEDCRGTIDRLAASGIHTMLDYAVEGRQREKEFDRTMNEIASAVEKSKDLPAIRSGVMKLTGLARFGLLEKINRKEALRDREEEEWKRVVDRVDRLCLAATRAGKSIFIDAEESWIQDGIDELAVEMMARYNRERAVVFGTIQAYRLGRLELLEKIASDARARSYHPGIKLVRGAYLEKEQEWAAERGVPPAVHTLKEDTDRDFNEALRFLVENLDRFSFCAATHNEVSTEIAVGLMEEKGLDRNDPRIEFSQLYGMGDHLTYNLAHRGYNASKYVPYGPVELVFPYLVRRAQENSSVHGQTGRELALVTKELKRRGAL